MSRINSASIIVIVFSMFITFVVNADNVLDQVGAGMQDVGTGIGDAASNVGDVIVDSAITTQVKALFALETDIPDNISVTTTDSVVYLVGEVPTRVQANRMEELAKSVNGVKYVNISNLKIEKSDNFLDDSIITTRVNAKISDLSNNKQIAAGADLHVETANGNVHIFGTVSDASDKDVIVQAITGMNGVNSVNTNIDVK